jgi:hypothetical protein
MADQAVAVPLEIDDKALFSGAMDNEPAQEAAPERETEQPERPRDEHGRFAPKTEQEQPEAPVTAQQETPAQQPQQPADDDKSGNVPSWRLREVREAREAAERRAEQAERERAVERQQLAALQREIAELRKPKQDPVDFYADPDAAFKQRLTPLEERQANFESAMQFRLSRTMAIAEHGAAAVKEMEEAVRKANREGHPEIRQLSAQMDASDDPVSVAMNWHKRTKLMDSTGGDLDAYRQRILDEAAKDPAFQAKVLEAARAQAGQQQPGSRPAINLPPSLNRAPGSGVTNAELDDADMSDRALFKHAAPARR